MSTAQPSQRVLEIKTSEADDALRLAGRVQRVVVILPEQEIRKGPLNLLLRERLPRVFRQHVSHSEHRQQGGKPSHCHQSSEEHDHHKVSVGLLPSRPRQRLWTFFLVGAPAQGRLQRHHGLRCLSISYQQRVPIEQTDVQDVALLHLWLNKRLISCMKTSIVRESNVVYRRQRRAGVQKPATVLKLPLCEHHRTRSAVQRAHLQSHVSVAWNPILEHRHLVGLQGTDKIAAWQRVYPSLAVPAAETMLADALAI
mmetsp:Transcript_12594/g.38520  ORF Transcript_12594/g.38520 Transcript_12594/m.38520 type:complete len:255 (-) Transcript_12594:923-1687(-)